MNKKKLKGLTVLSAAITLSLAGGILAGCGGNEDHNLSAVNEVAATCTTDGHRSYYKCTDDGCGKYFADAEGKEELSEEDVVLHALGHNPVHHEEKDVTCTEDGNAEYWGCSRCDAKFADENQTPFNGDPVLAHPGHHFTDVTPATDPEPDKEGNVEHWHCDRCEKNYNNSYGDKEIEDVTIPAIAKLDSVTLKLQGYTYGKIRSDGERKLNGRRGHGCKRLCHGIRRGMQRLRRQACVRGGQVGIRAHARIQLCDVYGRKRNDDRSRDPR